MIPRRFIEEWKQFSPWPENSQLEQDLIIERSLIELFSDELIRKSLAFRGGTALHKLYLKPQSRYSEDIDLVQIENGPISPVLKRIREKLSFLGTKRTVKQHIHNNTILYRFETEIQPVIKMRLKIEINTREHFNVFGLKELPFAMDNSWFSGNCEIISYSLEELLGTKLRALYQRRKGRDLFDIYWAITNHPIQIEDILKCYREYMSFSASHSPSSKIFSSNLDEKMLEKDFNSDIQSVLRPGIEYDQQKACELVKKRLIDKI